MKVKETLQGMPSVGMQVKAILPVTMSSSQTVRECAHTTLGRVRWVGTIIEVISLHVLLYCDLLVLREIESLKGKASRMWCV